MVANANLFPDQPAQILCETCSDVYCEVCFAAQHRKGSRKLHTTRPVVLERVGKREKKGNVASGDSSGAPTGSDDADADAVSLVTKGYNHIKYDAFLKMDVEMEKDGDVVKEKNGDEEVDEEDSDEDWERVTPAAASTTSSVELSLPGALPIVGSSVGDWFFERSKYIPMRLTLAERKYLRLLEAALTVSEYTDKIDTIGFGLSKAKRIVQQIRELCAIMSGLLLSADYKQGQELFQHRDFQANADFYQTVFELGRRHKIMNPEKMRTTYGKLIYLLQVGDITLPSFLSSFSTIG